MEDIINWIIAHWDEIVQIGLGIIGVASIIVKLTPQQKDDKILAKIMKVLAVLSLQERKKVSVKK